MTVGSKRSIGTRPSVPATGPKAPPQAKARPPQPLKVGLAQKNAVQTVGGVPTAGPGYVGVDQALGLHFQKVLKGQTLSGNAANAKNLRKLEEAARLIGQVERFPGRLGAIATFKPSQAFHLYTYLFPNEDEREEISVIKKRLRDYDQGADAAGNGFFALAITDKKRRVIGYTQGSTVPTEQGLFYYWQYGGVADAKYMKERYGVDGNPREHGVLNTIHAANTATLNATAQARGKKALGCIWESEPRGLGDNPSDIQFTAKRLEIHNRAGGRVMMGQTADGELVNLHFQPSLGEGKDPIALHMMFRPLKYEEGEEQQRGELNKKDAGAMLMAWVNNFRVEEFAEKDVAHAEAEIARRLARCEKIVLLPAAEVPDVVTLAQSDPLLADQLLKTYGVANLSEARDFYERAMATPLKA